MSISRRTVVASGLAATGAVTLAACAAEPGPEPVETTPPSATVDETPEELAGEILLGSTAEVMIGSGTKFMVDESLTILVTQPREGVFRAFSAKCTHAGCIVNGIRDDQIACGCHGARFSPDTGEPVAGPANSPLGKIQLEVRGSDLYALI
mgnify:CR=1 FL=1